MRDIAIVGGFGAGKTTLSDALVEAGYTRVSFAALLKEMAARAYGGPIEKGLGYYVTDLSTGKDREITGRRVLQELGQAVKAMDRDFWVNALLNDIADGKYGSGPFVTDDCRFPYEAKALHAEGFIVVKLEVPLAVRIERYNDSYGVYPTEAETHHESEIELEDIEVDYTLNGENPRRYIRDAILALAK